MGLKYVGEHHGATAAIFEIRRPMAGHNTDNILVEEAVQTNCGIEGTMYGEILPEARLLFGASWLDPEIEGKDTIGSPYLLGNLNFEWDVPGATGLTLGGQWMYTGEQCADAENTQKVPSWRRLDLGTRYVMTLNAEHALTLRLRVENVENQNYWASSGGYPDEGYLTLSVPRILTFSIDINFFNL